MNTNERPQLAEDPADRLIREAVLDDMARVYGEERRREPRPAAPARELLPIFTRRQAE